jgi:predicted ATPase/class 3 adenylate cyclase/DNA-binding CsgD family transcriptional regulator
MMEDVAGLPEGTVTFLLTDVEGSTRLWSADPDAAAAAIRRTYEVIDACVEAHGGVRPVEQGEGDSTVSVFSLAGPAVAAALEAQLALVQGPWPDGAAVAVRMALHTGEAELRDAGNYMGTTVIRCARLRELGSGGDVLLSAATAGLVADQLPDEAELSDCGEHELRDLMRPERVWRLTHPGLGPSRPLRSAGPGERTNLHRGGTPLVGRQRELGELAALLEESALVTLTGSGGVGKTRLAREAAIAAVERFSAGSWWVDLAPVTDPGRVPATVAAAIRVPEEPGRPAIDSLLAALERRDALVVLDNCEHLVDAVADLAAAVTERCPDVRLLATSREPLGVAGEVTWRTPSLAVPPESAATAEAVGSVDAVELFCRRARAARPGFSLTDADAPAVAEICRRLDGLPLAIELAAARVRTMSLEHLRASLDDRFRTLTGGARTALPRQRTLTASVAWSYDHLDQEARVLFRRLAVFAGAFTAEAAEAVCSDDDIPAGEILTVLASLADRSMVEVLDDGRYRLLETLRHFAQEQAVQAGEIDTWRDRHLDWFCEVATALDVGPQLDAAGFQEGVELLPDLRQALTWALATDVDPADLVRTIAEIWSCLASYDDIRTLGLALYEALDPASPRWISAMAGLGAAPFVAGDLATMERQAEALTCAVEPFERSRLLLGSGLARLFEGHPDGERDMREAADLAAAGGSATDVAGPTLLLASFLGISGRQREARPLVEDLVRRTAVTDGPWAGELANLRGWTVVDASIPSAMHLFRHAAAQLTRMPPSPLVVCALWGRDAELAEEALGGDRWANVGGTFEAFAGAARAIPALLAGDFEVAATALRPALELWTMGNVSYWVRLLDADVALRQGDRARAERDLEHVGSAIEGRNLPTDRTWLCVLRAGLALLDGEVRAAQDLAHQALALGVDNDAAMLVVDGLEAVAITDHRLGRPEVAARLVGAAEAQRDRSGYRWRHAPLDAEVPGILADESLHEAVAEGRRLSLEEAVAYATRARGARDRAAHGWDALTPAELEVTRLVGEGCTNQQIADRLFVSVATVKTHLVHTYDKLGTRSRSDLAAQAARRAGSGGS